MLGWKNQVTAGVLTQQTSGAAGMDPSQLQSDQGSAATAWQTAGLGAQLTIDSGSDTTVWRAFLLARTNLTAAATVHWRVGSADAMLEASPAISFNFANSTLGALTSAGWTFTRASIATVVATGGTLNSVAANQPRINASGLLIEGPATNLFANNNSATVNQTCGAASTISNAGGPNYTGALTTQSQLGAGTDTNVYTVQASGLTSGQTYTGSFWLWIPSGTTLTGMTVAWEGAATGAASSTINLALRDQFQLVWASATIAATTSNVVLRHVGAAVGSQFYLCSRQVELGRSPTSYIHTAGATASRAADLLTLTTGVPAACASGSYTLSVSANWLLTPPSGAICDVSLSQPGTTGCTIARYSTQAQGFAFSAANAVTSTLSQSYVGALSARIVNAVSPGTFAFKASSGAEATASGLVAGAIPNTLSAQVLNEAAVFVSSVAVYSSRLSDAQIVSLATTGFTATGNTTLDTGDIAAGVQPGFGQSVYVAAADVVGRYCRLNIADPANPDGFFNIPLMYAGPVLQPLRNYDYASSSGVADQKTQKLTRSGGIYNRTDWLKRTFDLSLSGIRSTEIPQFAALETYARQGGNVVLIPDPASATRSTEAVFGLCEPSGGLTYPNKTPEARGWRALITERL